MATAEAPPTTPPALGLTVIGESLMDVIHGAAPGQVDERVGGSPLNVAVGCARLGMSARLATHLGQDRYGRTIAHHLAENSVEAIIGGAGPTSTATAVLGEDGAAAYSFALEWEIADAALAALAAIEGSVHVHTGSIATMVAPGARTVLSLIQGAHANTTTSYDPNCRPAIVTDPDAARRQAEAFIRSSDIVKASDEDLGWLYPERTIDEAAAAWLEAGPALVVVTRGASGSFALTRSGKTEMAAKAADIVDTVGAGDSFMAALIAGLGQLGLLGGTGRAELRRIDRQRLRTLLEYAAGAAALTCSRLGADPPSLAELGSLAATPAA